MLAGQPQLNITVNTMQTYYQGDTIQISGIASAQGGPVGGVTVSIQVSGLSGNILHVSMRQTATDGSYTDIFRLPEDTPPGTYTVYVTAYKRNFQQGFNTTCFTVIENHPPTIGWLTASPIIGGKGMNITFQALVEDESGVYEVKVELQSPDENTLWTLYLYDDGTHGDQSPGDHIYTNILHTGQLNITDRTILLVDVRAMDMQRLESESKHLLEIVVYIQPDVWDVIWAIQKFYEGACSIWDVNRVIGDYYSL